MHMAVQSWEFILYICTLATKKSNLKEHYGVYQYILSIKGTWEWVPKICAGYI